MKNKQIIIAVVAAVLLVSLVVAVAYINNSNQANKENEAAQNTQTSIDSQSQPSETNSQASTSPGAYVQYTDEIIQDTPGTKVLFFHAPWCPQCMALEKSIESGKIPDGVTIIKVDYDSNQDLRKEYGVTLQTTLVRVDDSGKSVKKYTAYNQPTLQALIDNVL